MSEISIVACLCNPFPFVSVFFFSLAADCGHLDRDGGLWKVIYPSKQPSYTFLRYDCQYNLNVSPDYDGWCLAAKYALTGKHQLQILFSAAYPCIKVPYSTD